MITFILAAWPFSYLMGSDKPNHNKWWWFFTVMLGIELIAWIILFAWLGDGTNHPLRR
jgi:biotin transporter BioY